MVKYDFQKETGQISVTCFCSKYQTTDIFLVLYFSAFGLNTEGHKMLLIFSSNEWKYRTGKTLFSGTNPERLITLPLAHSAWFYAFFTFSDSSISYHWSIVEGGVRGGGEFFEIFIKRGFRYFSWKGMGWWNRGEGGVLKKRVSLIIILSNPFQCFLSLGVCCVCVLFIYATSTSIICVWQEELSFIASNQQIYDLHKWVIFEKKKHFRK